MDLSTAGEREGPFALPKVPTSFHMNQFLTAPSCTIHTGYQESLGLDRHTEREIYAVHRELHLSRDNDRSSDHCHSHIGTQSLSFLNIPA